MPEQGMVVGGFITTPGEVQQASRDVELMVEKIRQELTGIRGYVQVLGGSWQGSAYNTFDVLMQDYDAVAQRCNFALEQIKHGLHGNFMTYADTEQGIETGMQRLIATLPPANF